MSEVRAAALSDLPPDRPFSVSLNGTRVALVRVGEEVRFTFNVANAGSRRVEGKFSSGQTHDIVVLDSAGRELWRWAEGRMFTEARQYRAIGGGSVTEAPLLWVLNLSDGDHGLLDVAGRAGLPFALVAEVAGTLEDAGLLRRADG